MQSIELFAGAGGLGMGIHLAGFKHQAVIEWDAWACETMRENQSRGFPLMKKWPLYKGDVRKFDFKAFGGKIDLVSGGPPCQPFSIGGKHRAYQDGRDMFPAAVSAVRQLHPQAFIFENVRGLSRPTFFNYFQYILFQFTYPEITKRAGESWQEHLGRLERYKTSGRSNGLWYRVVPRVLNAANYGVPQKRERVFIVGFRCDLEVEWSFPKTTHSLDALLVDQWVTGEYWERHRVQRKRRPVPSPKVLDRIDRMKNFFPDQDPRKKGIMPWRTVRDALVGLPDPKSSNESTDYPNHRFQPGARAYTGHTGSPLDEPAKTLKAGDHGVPGGENMLALPDGCVRYFTVRESARLQTFPDDFVFHGSWTETMRQLGNAVPVDLAAVVAKSVMARLRSSNGS